MIPLPPALLANVVLAWMVAKQPVAPWRASYVELADAIAEASEERPLFVGDDGVGRTAAVLTEFAFRESSFDAEAVGDHGHSWGAFQVSSAHASPGELVEPLAGARHALRLLRVSFHVCRERPLEERAAWYTAGGVGCPQRGVAASRRRMVGAKSLWVTR